MIKNISIKPPTSLRGLERFRRAVMVDEVCSQCDLGYHERCRRGDCGCGCNK